LWEWVKVGTDAVNFIYCVNVPAPPKRYYTLLFSILLLRFFSIIQLSLKFLLSFIVVCVVRGRESCMGNGIQNSFHNVLKRILYSVSKKFAIFFMKRNTESVSKRYETDSVFRFIKKIVLKRILYSVSKKFAIFFMKRNTESVSKRYETDSVFRFIKKIVLKRILYSVSKKFAIFFMKRNTESVS